jgi:hypothetical protein
MHTATYSICVVGDRFSEGLPPLRLCAREYGARLLAMETFEHHNAGRMVTRSVLLLENGVPVDLCLDGKEWMSGYVLDPND